MNFGAAFAKPSRMRRAKALEVSSACRSIMRRTTNSSSSGVGATATICLLQRLENLPSPSREYGGGRAGAPPGGKPRARGGLRPTNEPQRPPKKKKAGATPPTPPPKTERVAPLPAPLQPTKSGYYSPRLGSDHEIGIPHGQC